MTVRTKYNLSKQMCQIVARAYSRAPCSSLRIPKDHPKNPSLYALSKHQIANCYIARGPRSTIEYFQVVQNFVCFASIRK